MRQMRDAEIQEFLGSGTRTGKLATALRSGQPHVAPVWFVLDGDAVVFTTGRDTLKGRHLRRDGRVALCVDDDRPPYAYVELRGRAELVERAPDLLAWTTRIAARYVAPGQAEAYGRRNAVADELLVRLRPEHVVALAEISA